MLRGYFQTPLQIPFKSSMKRKVIRCFEVIRVATVQFGSLTLRAWNGSGSSGSSGERVSWYFSRV